MTERSPASRVVTAFDALRASDQRAIIPFVCGGYPSIGASLDAVRAVACAGAPVIEIGVPFSDPIADGPVIAAAMHDALRGGATPAQLFDAVAAARNEIPAALVAMVSVSIVQRFGGAEAFAARASDAGFDGLIVPDCPLEESRQLIDGAAKRGLTLSLLVAPTTPPQRAAEIARASTGFVYLLARTGITGERADAPDVGKAVANLRTVTPIPIACGFGISTPDHVRAVVEHADAAIVGTAIVKRMAAAAASGGDAVAAAADCVRALSAGLTRTPAGL